MPKRSLKYQLNNPVKSRKKSKPSDNSTLSHSLTEDAANEISKDDDGQNASKQMRYMKKNHQNEIERLLLRNSKKLEYHVDHSIFPAFNVGLWPDKYNEDFIDYPSFAFSVPRPLYVSNNQCEKIDLCFKRPMTSEFYKKGLRYTRSTYQATWKANKALRNAAKDGVYHSSVFDLAERAYLHPDPYFYGSYDYYFTGGNLCTLASGNIVHAGGENLRNLMVSTFPVDENCSLQSLVNLSTHTTSEDGEIFEISPLLTSLECSKKNCFIARQRNLISFNNLNEEKKEIKTVTQFRTKSTPFISCAQSERDNNIFIVTTMKQHIRLYDLNRSVPALVKLFEIPPKPPRISWNTTKPWRENTFLYANDKQFFLIDVRTTPDQWMKEVTLAVDGAICDHISAMMPSDFNNLFYVATNHKLHCMDIRHLKKFSFSEAEGAVCRWSHQLLYAPLMIDSFRLRQTEYIALSSALPGDLHICQLNRERNDEELSIQETERVHKHMYYSPCLPYQPPTLMEAYQNARLSGNCLNPEGSLEDRIKCCTTGMSFYKPSASNTQSEKVGLLLTSNSNGDVFAHTLSKREKNGVEIRCNAESDENMAEFERKICQQSKSTLNYTHIKNMKSLRKVFLCKNLSSVTKYDFDAMDNEFDVDETPANNEQRSPTNQTNAVGTQKRKRARLGRWQKPLSTLYSYKDALVTDLLSIWDIDIDEEKYIHLGNLQLNVKTESKDKVNSWLDKNANSNPPMLSIPAQEAARYENSNVSNTFDSSVNLTQNTVADFDNAVHSTQIEMNNSANILDISNLEIQIQNNTNTTVVEKLKNKKKTKKYVKGF